MARRTFNVIDVTEILVHWHAGRSQSEVADSLGVDRKTVKKYLAPAIGAGIVPGDEPRTQAQWQELVRGWFPELVDTRLRQITWPVIAVHRDYIAEQLRVGVTKATIHQRLRDECGLTASCASLKRWVAANLAEEAMRARVTVLRGEVEPGSEALCGIPHNASYETPGNMRRRWDIACSGGGLALVGVGIFTSFRGTSATDRVAGRGAWRGGPGQGLFLEVQVGVEVDTVGRADVLVTEPEGDGGVVHPVTAKGHGAAVAQRVWADGLAGQRGTGIGRGGDVAVDEAADRVAAEPVSTAVIL
jgi:hypothetical protein